jgi:hypothetical protein
MLQSRNPFLLLKHADMLTQEQLSALSQSIVSQLHSLIEAIDEDKFSGEQIAEMKVWVQSLVKSLKHYSLGGECFDLVKKLLNAT